MAAEFGMPLVRNARYSADGTRIHQEPASAVRFVYDENDFLEVVTSIANPNHSRCVCLCVCVFVSFLSILFQFRDKNIELGDDQGVTLLKIERATALLQLETATENLDQLQTRFADLDPANRQLGASA